MSRNNYRYSITDRLGTVEAGVLGEYDFTVQWSRQKDVQRYYKKELPNKMVFTGDMFKRLMKLERSIYRCDTPQITVFRPCTTGGTLTWKPLVSGIISLNDGNFSPYKGKIEISVSEANVYDCYEANKATDVNILSTNTPISVRLYDDAAGTIETITKTGQETEPNAEMCYDYYWDEPGTYQAKGWAVYYHDMRYYNSPDGTANTCFRTTKYARLVQYLAPGSPAPAGWVFLDNEIYQGNPMDKYAKPATTYNCVFSTPDEGGNYTTSRMECQILGDAANQITVPNGRLVSDILSDFVSNYCHGLTVKSNFLQINPDQVTDINYVTNQVSKTNHLVVFQKSDVKRWNDSNRATIGNLNFEKLLTALTTFYNLNWRIEGSFLIIEHVSWFTPGIGMDLTWPEFEKYLHGLDDYSYDKTAIPMREEFKTAEASGGDFAGYPIVYNNGCVSKSADNNVITRTIDGFTTDVQLCLGHPGSDDNVVSDDGFVLIACKKDGEVYTCITEAGIVSQAQLNNSLAWAQLHRDYWKYERPLITGNMNNQDTTFFSSIPIKKGIKIAVPLSCEVEFNPDLKVKTPFGIGVVDKATYRCKDGMLEFELLYAANEGLTDNQAPTTQNRVVTLNKNTFIDIDVVSTSNDPDGVITAVKILLAPSHGTATILPNNNIRYTPYADYTGQDNIVFQVLDDWGEASNNGLISVTIPSGPPVAEDFRYVIYTDQSGFTFSPIDQFSGQQPENFTAVTLVTNPPHAGIQVSGLNIILNPTGWAGTDYFTYYLTDKLGQQSNNAQIQIDYIHH